MQSLAALGRVSELSQQLADQSGPMGKLGGMFGGFLSKLGPNTAPQLTASAGAAPTTSAPRATPWSFAQPSGPASAPATSRREEGALITGCQAHETSADACPGGDATRAYGALTNALTTIVRQHKRKHPNAPISYKDLVTNVRAMLHKAKFTQNPCLECADDTVSRPFIC